MAIDDFGGIGNGSRISTHRRRHQLKPGHRAAAFARALVRLSTVDLIVGGTFRLSAVACGFATTFAK